jgi:F0F1-type ATP synthase membrane subunit a
MILCLTYLMNKQISDVFFDEIMIFSFSFCHFVILLLFCNLIDMMSCSFTATSHFIITLSFSLFLFIGIIIVGFQTHEFHFLKFIIIVRNTLVVNTFLCTS